ncbi:MAG: hypothetical protein ACR2HD_10360 [Solirubrobacteraceae bacterium]|nr:MAG: hypothetical protein DLM63_02740 [Solirubrobacterales bacterium]
MTGRAHSDEEIDAAIAALNEPERLHMALEMVGRTAPQLQHVLSEALAEGGWFGQAHEGEVRKAADAGDPEERLRLVRTLVAEETRLGMLIGVAVGYELAQELKSTTTRED